MVNNLILKDMADSLKRIESNLKLRKVEVHLGEYQKISEGDVISYIKIKGRFHGWNSQLVEEYGDTFIYGIIEKLDGNIILVPHNNIRFIKEK